MAKVLITEDYLSDIADAIREKKSSQDTYTPAEMADAIESIQTGITPTGTKSVSITSNGTTTEDVTNYASVEIAVNVPSSSPTLITKSITENGTYSASSDNADGYSSVAVNVSSGGDYVAADWGDPTKPTGEITITRAYATSEGDSCGNLMYRRSAITIVHMPNTTYLPHNYFSYSSLAKLDAPLLEEAGSSSISSCSSLTGLVLPKFRNSRNNGSFMTNGNLVYADFGGSTGGATMANLFLNCTKLNLLILRASTVWTLTNTNAFNGTCFASGKTGGTLYVPQALISAYQSDTNWGTILGYANNQIKAIEGSIYENQYADGTSISS